MRGLCLLLLVACSYKAPTNPQGDDQPGNDAPPPDVLPDPMICTEIGGECIGSLLRECQETGVLPVDTPCAQLCNPNTLACETLTPNGGAVTAGDLANDPAIETITIAADARFDTGNGEITGVRGQGNGVVDGIEFEVVNEVGIWRFHRLTIDGAITFRGGNAAALAANREITVNALIDARGQCGPSLGGGVAGPGGDNGGLPEQDGGGTGKGIHGVGQPDNASGGSGAGHGVTGGGGASSANQGATTGGANFGNATVMTLRGGSGGGGGGGEINTAGVGGGGGGGLQLVANDRITFTATGAINAGGCGGSRNPLGQNAGGGGGGSGGTILLEAVEVVLDGATILAVNGGGGSGGDNGGQSGQNGPLSRTAATGGGGTGGGAGTSGGKGGDGGAPGSLNGSPGSAGSSNQNAGGGGGAVGRIRINTRGDTNLVGDCALCSPNFNDAATTTRGAANIQ